MPRDNARRVLSDPCPVRADIEAAIACLERDIAYVKQFHPLPSKEMCDSIEESRRLLVQLQDKLNSQSK